MKTRCGINTQFLLKILSKFTPIIKAHIGSTATCEETAFHLLCLGDFTPRDGEVLSLRHMQTGVMDSLGFYVIANHTSHVFCNPGVSLPIFNNISKMSFLSVRGVGHSVERLKVCVSGGEGALPTPAGQVRISSCCPCANMRWALPGGTVQPLAREFTGTTCCRKYEGSGVLSAIRCPRRNP